MQFPQTINESYYCLRPKADGPVSILTTNSYVVGEYDVHTGEVRWGRVVLATQKVQIMNYLHRHFPPVPVPVAPAPVAAPAPVKSVKSVKTAAKSRKPARSTKLARTSRKAGHKKQSAAA